MKRAYLAVAAALCLQGCTAITQDLRHTGGYPGYLLDKHSFDAKGSKQLLLLRSAIVVAMAARMSNATIQNPDEADSVARYLSASVDELNYAAADIYPVDGAQPCGIGTNAAAPGTSAKVVPLATGCFGYYANFESELPLLEGRVIRLMFATLPQERMKNFAADVQNGNVMGGAWNALKLIFVGVKGLHYAAGSYRSGEEAVVANFSAECKPETTMTVYQAVECLGLSHDSLFGPHSNEAGVAWPTTITPPSFDAILTIARTSCVRLPLGSGDSDTNSIIEAAKARAGACAKIKFDPKPRPDSVPQPPAGS